MRITYIHQYFRVPSSAGGTRSYEFARRLIAKGHQVLVVTSTANLKDEYRQLPQFARAEVEGVPTRLVHVPYANEMGYNERGRAFAKFAALASLAACREEADVVFATSTPLSIAIPAIAAKLRYRVPMVFEVRDLWPELPIAVGALRNPVARSAARLLEWVAYHSSAQVVALSPGMADGVATRGIPRERITVIPNSCDIDQFDVPAERGQHVRERIPNLQPDQPLVVYTGTFGRINGVAYLVEVAAAMRGIDPGVCFLLVGGGAEKEEVTRRARAAGVLGETLWMWERMPKLEIPDLLAAATVATSVFVPIPAMQNNSANKFFDALAAGRPIAINYEGWQADLIRQSGAGVVLPATDAQAAALALARFVRDPVRLQQGRAAARRLAHEQFSRDLMADRLEGVLLKAASKR